MEYANLEKVKKFIREDMGWLSYMEYIMECKKPVCIYDQSGYDFVCKHIKGYLDPFEYAKIVNEMDLLSN